MNSYLDTFASSWRTQRACHRHPVSVVELDSWELHGVITWPNGVIVALAGLLFHVLINRSDNICADKWSSGPVTCISQVSLILIKRILIRNVQVIE